MAAAKPGSEKRTADGFEETGHSGETVIGGAAGIMSGIEARRGDPGTGLRGEAAGIQNVIEVAVGEDDPGDRKRVPAGPFQRAGEQGEPADEAAIQQDDTSVMTKGMEAHSRSLNADQARAAHSGGL